MAVSQRQLDYVARRLDEFQQEKRAFQDALDLYEGNVISAVSSWLERRGRNGPHLNDLNAFLGKSLMFLIEKTEEIESKSKDGDEDVQRIPEKTRAPSLAESSSPSLSSAESLHLPEKSSQLSEISEQLKKLTTRFDGLSDQFSSSLQEYTQNRSKDRGQMKKLEERMNQVENSVHDMSVDLSKVDKKVKKYDEKIGDLDKKVGSIEEKQSVLEKEKKKESDLIRNIQKKIEQKESDQRMLEDLAERVEKIEKEEERVDVQIQRLGMLEDHLRGIEKERGNNTKEIGEMKRDLTACNSKVDSIEKRLHPALGFTACIRDGAATLTKDTVVKEFTHIVSNKGKHYSPTTGVFTAPVDGLYMVALTHFQHESDRVYLQVICERVSPGPGGEREEVVCESYTDKECTNCSDMSVVEMTGGDKLYVKVIGGGWVESPSGFSCFLIG